MNQRCPAPRPAASADTRRQAIVKTLTFALLHFGVAFSVAYALTGSIAVAVGIGLIEPVLNTIVFYFHERAGERAGPGRAAGRQADGFVTASAR
jgi:uncharacterized membrane protein